MTSAPIVTAARAAGPDDAIAPRAFKGDSVRVFGAGVRQADGLSDFVIDVRGYNALSLDITTFGSPGATLTVEGLAGAAGIPVVLPDPNATQVGVSTSRIVDVVCGQPFAKLRLTGGTYTGGAGYVVVVTPYIAPGQISLNITAAANENIAQWGGVATTLGQKLMAASVPVVLPSDQGLALNLNQVGGAAIGLGQAAMAASLPIAVASNQTAVPSSNGSGTQVDGHSLTIGAIGDTAWSGTGNSTLVAALKALWARLRGGQATMANSLPVVVASDQASFPVSIGAGTALLGATTPGASATVGTGLTAFFNGALTNTAVAVKASAGKLHTWTIQNPSAALAFVQVFDLAAASVTVGTTTPKEVLPIPAGGVLDGGVTLGYAHAAAIAIAATTTATGSSAPGTALVVMLGYI